MPKMRRTPDMSAKGALPLPAILAVVFVSFLVVFGIPGSAYAQEEDDPFAGIEEMVVVGTGAASLFQNQEVSAIAFDADYLEAIGASDLTDVATFTPNLEIRTPFAASNPTLFIRGVGLRDFNANSSSSVAVYNDEIYMNSPAGQLSQLFDTQNIDVLRGPQTTMYARNASAGTIRVVARKPTGTPGTTSSLTYGRFNQVEIETAVENVIIPDMLTMRSSGKWSQRDGTAKNRCADSDYNPERPPRSASNGASDENIQNALVNTVSIFCFGPSGPNDATVPGSPGDRPIETNSNGFTRGEEVPVKEWVNDNKNFAARTILRFQHEFLDMDWLLNFHGGQNRGDARQFQLLGVEQNPGDEEPRIAGGRDDSGYFDADNRIWTGPTSSEPITDVFQGNVFEGDYNNAEKERIDLFGANLVGKMTFGDYQLTTITGYEWNKRQTELNLDGNPFKTLEPVLKSSAYQVTQELRLDWDRGDGFEWQLGGMYLYEGLEADNKFSLSPILYENYQDFTFFTRYATGWVSADWEPIETFSLHGGFRISHEDKELNLDTGQRDFLSGVELNRPRAFAAAKETGWAGDVIATYMPLADVSIYLRYARGWKGPHINAGVFNASSANNDRANLTNPIDPEVIDSVEMGMKAEFWANRIRWNWAVFYYDYQDIQVFQLKNVGSAVPVQELISGDDADILGFEMEFDVKPFEGWAPPVFEGIWIRATFAWLDSKYTDFVNTEDIFAENRDGNPVRRTIRDDYSGNRLVNSPEYSFIGFVAWPIGGEWGALIPRVDWSFKDKVYFGPSNAELVSQDALWIFNMRVAYKSPTETFELSGWIKNLTDQSYTVDVFNLSRVRGSILYAIGDPRTYGVTMKVSF